MTNKLTFHVVRYPVASGNRYIATAWNYDITALLSTHDYATYTEARKELDDMVAERALVLQWFDGSYVYEQGALVPCDKLVSD